MTARTSRAPVAARRAAADRPGPRPSRLAGARRLHVHVAAVAMLAIAVAAVLPEVTLGRRAFTSPDYDSPSYFGAAGRAALAAGEYPLWNPYIFLGMPSFASLACTPYVYPLSELLGALGRLPLAPPLLWLLFYYAAAGYGVFLVLRALDAEPWAAVLGGVVFMLDPHLVSMGVFGHGSKLASVAYLPYLLLLALRLRQAGRRLVWTGLLGLALGLQLLRGHPQIAYYGLLMLGAVAVAESLAALRRRVPRGEWARFAAGLTAGVGLGFGLAAVLLLPVRAYAPLSIRGAGTTGGAAYEYATNWSLSPSEVATFFVPAAMGFGEATYAGHMPFTNFPHYLGQASLVFGVALLVLVRGRLVWTLLGVALLALAVSFGKHLPFVYDLFYRYLPYFSKFRVPVMILVLLQLAASVAAGLGLSALWARLPRGCAWRREPGPRDAARLLAAAAAAAVVLFVLVQPWSAALAERVAASPRLPPEARAPYADIARRMLQDDALRVGALLVAHAAVVFLAWRRRLPADLAGLLLVALTGIDLGAVDRRMVAPEKTWPGLPPRTGPPASREAVASDVARWLLQQPQEGAAPVRILAPGPSGFMNNEWMAHGIASAGGYHPAKLVRFEKLVHTSRNTLDPRLADLFAVRYFVVPEAAAGAREPVFAGAGGVVYANPTAQPRAWVTGRYARLGSGDCGAALLADDFDRSRVVLLEAEPQPEPDSTATGTARIVGFTANRVVLDVEATGPALVVLAEAYHPDWRARVDGEPRPVLAADCVLRAVAVPAGASRLELEFTSPALRAGLAVTSVSAAFAAVLLALGLARRRRGGPW